MAVLTLIFGSVAVVANLALTQYSDAFTGIAGPIWAGLFLAYTKERNESGYYA